MAKHGWQFKAFIRSGHWEVIIVFVSVGACARVDLKALHHVRTAHYVPGV